MADWSILRTAGKDYLSPLSYNTHDAALAKFHMMSSFIDSLSPSSIYDENTFCTGDNIEDCITHLNAELTGLGLQPLSRDGIGLTTSALNSLNEIVRMNQKSGRIKEDLENRLHRLNSDITQNYSVTKRLKADKDRLERECAQEQEKHRQTHGKVKMLSAKLKTEKEELKKLQAIIKDRDAQYKHELKKKQREINKLMERLHQLLLDKNPDRRIGMDMIGLLHRGDGKRSKWKNASSVNKQEEMYQIMISKYEEKQQELRVENSDLRDCLLDMQRELNGLLDTSAHTNGNISGSSSETDLSSSSTQSHNLHDDYFQMPYDILRENLKKSFQGTCKKIRESIKKCSNSSYSSLKTSGKSTSPTKSPSTYHDNNKDSHRKSEELEKLSRQIEKYKEIVKQQEELIQKSLHTQSKSMENSFLQESQILQEKESLSEQRRKFYQEKANFEEERQKFTELALQLQQERKQIENEKNEFFKAQFLQLSPCNSKSPTPPKSYKGEKTRLLPSTPVFSPAPGKAKSASPVFSPAPGKAKSASPADVLKMIQVGKHQLSLSDRSSSGKASSNKISCNDSMTSSCVSIHSAPSDLMQGKTNKRLPFEEFEQIEKDLLSCVRRRRSSTGSQSSLDGQ